VVLAFQTRKEAPEPPPSLQDIPDPDVDLPPEGDDDGGERPGLNNPPFAWRVALVGAVIAMPGVVAGALACALLGTAAHAGEALIAGGLVGAIFGMALEASG
jgi:hypothetical protein